MTLFYYSPSIGYKCWEECYFMEVIKAVVLSDGRKVVLEDKNGVILFLISNDISYFTFPSDNYGGGSLMVSPSEQYLVFSYYSGQSEEGFLLFSIDNNYLKPLYNSDYIYGEDANYCFLNDEKLLIQTFRTNSWYKEYAEVDENGDKYYDFGEINIFNIETQHLDRHSILIYPSDDWVEEETDVGLFLFSKMINENSISVIMPWGKETFDYPLKDTLVIKYK